MQKIRIKSVVVVLTFMIALSVTVYAKNIAFANISIEEKNHIKDELSPLTDLIKENYYKKINIKKIYEEVFKKIKKNTDITTIAKLFVSEIGDPYSEFYTNKEYKKIKNPKTDYCGIGIVSLKDPNTGNIIVKRVFENSPAMSSDIRQNDFIIKVGKKSVKALSLDKVAQLIKGKKGTEVLITIERNGEILKKRLKRNIVKITSVSSKLYEDIGYIKLENFSDEADEEFNLALDELEKSNIRALIIDLRNNLGGQLDTACNILNRILPNDRLLFTLRYKRGNPIYYITNEKKDATFSLPITILINENSASAAELFTGVLSIVCKADTVGTKSYGKGVAQGLYEIENDYGESLGAVKLTVAKYTFGNGENIDKRGIIPKYVVDTGSYNEDIQLEKALEILK